MSYFYTSMANKVSDYLAWAPPTLQSRGALRDWMSGDAVRLISRAETHSKDVPSTYIISIEIPTEALRLELGSTLGLATDNRHPLMNSPLKVWQQRVFGVTQSLASRSAVPLSIDDLVQAVTDAYTQVIDGSEAHRGVWDDMPLHAPNSQDFVVKAANQRSRAWATNGHSALVTLSFYEKQGPREDKQEGEDGLEPGSGEDPCA